MNQIKGVPVHKNEHFSYVKFSEVEKVLGVEQAQKFDEWMTGKTCPIVGHDMVAYSWDFQYWVELYN